MKYMKKNYIIGAALSIFVVAIMISTATAGPILNKADNELETDDTNFSSQDLVMTENEEVLNEEEAIFQLVADALNNEDLRKFLKEEFGGITFDYYTVDDVKDLYQKGLVIKETLDIDELKEKMNDFIMDHYDIYQKIIDFIDKYFEDTQNTQELTNDCGECTFYSNDEPPAQPSWYPGKVLACIIVAILCLPFVALLAFAEGLYAMTGIFGMGMAIVALGVIWWLPRMFFCNIWP